MEKQTENMFDGMYFTALLYRHRKFIAIVILLAAVVSVVISLLMPNWYTATANVVPPQNSMSGLDGAMGSISSTLKDIGLSKVGGSSGSGYSLTVIMESKAVKDSMIKRFDLRKVYEMEEAKYEDLLAEFDANREITYDKEGNYLVSMTDKDPKRAAEMANELVNIINYFASDVYRRESRLNKEYMERRLGSIDSTISAISEKLAMLSENSLMFSPAEQAGAISSALVELKAQVYQTEIEYDLLKSTYGEKDPGTIMRRKFLEESKKKLNDAMQKPGFAGNFKLNESGRIAIEYTKLYTEIEALSKAKAYLVPIYEKTSLDEAKTIQTLIVLDKAEVPSKKSKPKRSLIVAGSVFGVFVLCVLIIILVYNFKEFKRRYDAQSI